MDAIKARAMQGRVYFGGHQILDTVHQADVLALLAYIAYLEDIVKDGSAE